MQTSNEPATETQMLFLEQHGHLCDETLTRSQAAELIRKIRETSPLPGGLPSGTPSPSAYYLGACFEQSRTWGNAAARDDRAIQELICQRREFWLDTCREATQMHTASAQVFELYKMHGCRFSPPSQEEVQEVLSALDTAMPAWESNHPELFFRTLELNFPELVRQQIISNLG